MRTLALIAAVATLPFAAILPARAMAPGGAPAGIALEAGHGSATDGAIISVRDGCGPGGHRDPYGRCVPNYRPYYYGPPPRPFYRPCPPGFHFGPRAGRCFPNY